MNKEELESSISYNHHAVTMSDIAISLLEGGNPLNVKGVRELLAMYLLVPYVTKSQLDTPDDNCNIPKLDVNTVFTKVLNTDGSQNEMTLGRLRDAICHSFIALTEKGDLMLDDRASCDRTTHDSMTDKGFCNRLEVEKVRNKLLSLHRTVLEEQVKFNNRLLKEIEVGNE